MPLVEVEKRTWPEWYLLRRLRSQCRLMIWTPLYTIVDYKTCIMTPLVGEESISSAYCIVEI